MTKSTSSPARLRTPSSTSRPRSPAFAAQAYLSPHYADLFSRDHLPIDVTISPEVEVGEMVLRRITLPGATDVVRFADDQIIMVAIECQEECPVIDTPLSQLSALFPDLPSTVVGIIRDDKLFIPRSRDQMFAGDIAYVVTTRDQVKRTLSLFGHEEPDATRLVIAGGGNIGLYRRPSSWNSARSTRASRSSSRTRIARSRSPTSCAGRSC